jgi:hypothetical protein
MSSSFCSDLFANLLSDFLAVILGATIAWYAGKKLGIFEQSQRRKEERKAELEKAVRYLEPLNEEIAQLISILPDNINAFRETGWGREIRIRTPFWDVLQPSGELPRLLDPHLLASLALFYDHLQYAKRGKDLVIKIWLVPQPSSVPGMNLKLEAFVDITLRALEDALRLGRGLPSKLDSEIQALKAQLENL